MLTREIEGERMDDPMQDPAEYSAELSGLARLNAVSGSANIVWRTIRQFISPASSKILISNGCQPISVPQRFNPAEPIKVLDLACGSGDVAVSLWELAKRSGVQIQADGCDINPIAVKEATRRADAIGAGSRFFQLNALADELPDGYDIIMNSLFMHHLDEQNAVKILRSMARSAKHMVVISDLTRSEASLAMVTVACHMFSRNKVVHIDGPASVRAAYTPAELLNIASQAELHGAVVRQRFPCRMVLAWAKPIASS